MLNHIKFLGFYGQALKIAIFMLGSFLFTLSSGDSIPTDGSANELKVENPYFLDIDTLQSLRTRRRFQELIYIERTDPSAAWIIFQIRSRMRDYYSAVAGVVAAELHRRIDRSAVVPPSKFVIAKSEGGRWSLIGYVYQEIPFAKPIEKVMDKKESEACTHHAIYQEHNIEHSVSTWKYLGMPMLPDPLYLAISEDNRLIRYDYSKAFRYGDSDISERCFRIADFLIDDYRCDVGYIKNLKQNLSAQYHATLQEIIFDISNSARQYLTEKEQNDLNIVIEQILARFENRLP